MTQADAAVVRREIVVNAPLDKAFTVFTDRFGDFKPPEHNMLRVPIADGTTPFFGALISASTRARLKTEEQCLDTLQVLKSAGLVTNRAEGTRRVYRLNPAGVAALKDQLDTFWRRALDGYHHVIEDNAEENP